VRILFSTTAGDGHFGPLVPVGSACVVAGHEVAVAAPRSFADKVARAGFQHLSFGDPPPELMGAIFGRLPSLSVQEANRVVVADVFGRLDAQAGVADLVTTMRDWQPDLLVREPMELASMAAAEVLGIPQVQVAILMGQLGADIAGTLEEPLRELAALAGIEAERLMDRQLASPALTSVPAILDTSWREGQATWRYRVKSPTARGALPAPWGDPDLPLIYVTFGTVAATVGPFSALFGATLAALADVPARVLMTTGSGLSREALGPIPANAHVESWWPQADVMPSAAVAVGHGGFGTTMTAAAAGVPQVIAPLFAFDQFVNAERIAAVGAGLQALGGPAAAPAIRAAVLEILASGETQASARSLASEMAAMPDVATCVGFLEGCATDTS
jgi:UDP:flavonoid glycosyltransferase YjiC (YdhE family)